MKTTTVATPDLFGTAFDELFSTAAPFMSTFLKGLVVGMKKDAGKSTSPSRQQDLYDESVDCMAKGLEFTISTIIKETRTPERRILTLRKIVDDLIAEEAAKESLK